jgi:ketosteroid isomerase-like protein
MPSSFSTGDDSALGQAVEVLRQAIFASDKATLAALTAAELSYGHSTGLMQNKAEFIDGAINRKDVATSLDFSEVTTFVAGDVGVARHRWVGDNDLDGKNVHVDIRVLLIWQKQGGEWKLLARQAFKVA